MDKISLKIWPDDALRETCTPVEKFDKPLHDLLDQMKILMNAEQGIGLAANQVGILKRVFIADVSPMFSANYIEKYGPPGTWDQKLIEFINPQIVHEQGEMTWNEGCLSFPEIYFDVKRASHVTIRAVDRFGKSFEVDAAHILAICCQHELDHLNGNVFLDYVSPVKRALANSKLKKYKAEHE